jgi:hypothetical protein
MKITRIEAGRYSFELDGTTLELLKCDSQGRCGWEAQGSRGSVWWDIFYNDNHIEGSYESMAQAKEYLNDPSFIEQLTNTLNFYRR